MVYNCSDNECLGRSRRSQKSDVALLCSRLYYSSCPPGIQSACPGVRHWCLRHHHCHGHHHPGLLCSSVCVWHSACLPSLWSTAGSHCTCKVRPHSPTPNSTVHQLQEGEQLCTLRESMIEFLFTGCCHHQTLSGVDHVLIVVTVI